MSNLITIFGTCRLNDIPHNNLNNLINYTHTTKEVIQQIKFFLGDIVIPQPLDRFCFRTGIIENRSISYDPEFKRLFLDSSICIVEICSRKKYLYDGFYLHHLSVDKRFPIVSANTPEIILNNFKCSEQSDDEIENDILEIKKLIEPRKLIIASHYNSLLNGKVIEYRDKLITLVKDVCKKHNIPIINQSDVLKDYPQEEVMTNDLGHYTPLGQSKITEYIVDYIKSL